MPQPGRGCFPGLGLRAGAGKGEQLRHGYVESHSHSQVRGVPSGSAEVHGCNSRGKGDLKSHAAHDFSVPCGKV